MKSTYEPEIRWEKSELDLGASSKPEIFHFKIEKPLLLLLGQENKLLKNTFNRRGGGGAGGFSKFSWRHDMLQSSHKKNIIST